MRFGVSDFIEFLPFLLPVIRKSPVLTLEGTFLYIELENVSGCQPSECSWDTPERWSTLGNEHKRLWHTRSKSLPKKVAASLEISTKMRRSCGHLDRGRPWAPTQARSHQAISSGIIFLLFLSKILEAFNIKRRLVLLNFFVKTDCDVQVLFKVELQVKNMNRFLTCGHETFTTTT